MVISNYALSEMSREVQDMYLETVIRGVPRGYITCNRHVQKQMNGYTVEELVDKIDGGRIIEERPLTYPGNCVIVWGDEKDRGIGTV